MSFGPYADSILWSASRYGIPPAVLGGVLAQESGFNPGATGDNGNSVGMGQFNTKGALKHFGLTRDQVLEMDPATQIDFTAKFLRYNIDSAKGDLWEGVRRYNGGGDPKYLEHVRSRIPGEQLRRLPTSRGPQVDVRTASAEQMATPPGDPRTGMMNQTLPPDMTVLAPQAPASPQQQQQARMSPQDFYRDPFIQMGLGILANPAGGNASPLTGIARGVQQGMGAYNDLQQQQITNQLAQQRQKAYADQVRVSQMNALGMTQPNPADVARSRQKMVYWQGPGGPQDTMLTVWDPLRGPYGAHVAPNGQAVDPAAMGYTPTTSPGGGAAGGRSRNPDNYTVDSWSQYEKTGRSDPSVLKFRDKATKNQAAKQLDQDLRFLTAQTDRLLADFEKNPKAFGTPGKWARVAHGFAGTVDAYLGTDLDAVVAPITGGDPQDTHAKMLGMVRRASKLFVDSGRLSDQDRQMAEGMVGLPDGGWKSPKQARASLLELKYLTDKYGDGADYSDNTGVPTYPYGKIAPQGGATVPPQINAPAPGGGVSAPSHPPPGAGAPRVINLNRDAMGNLTLSP